MGVSRDPNRPKVPDLIPLIVKLYENSSVGCCHHVLFDDDNYDCAQFCLDSARERGHELCIKIGELAVQMTQTQLRKANKLAWKVMRG